MSKQYRLDGVNADLELGKGGVNLHANGTAIEMRTDDSNATLAITRGADPVGQTDYTTKDWVELYVQTQGAVLVTGQIDGGAPPVVVNGAVYVVTTTGGAYTEDELWRGEAGAWVNVPLVDGMVISIADALIGGTITFSANSIYNYDQDTTTWILIGPAVTSTSYSKVIKKNLVFGDWAGPLAIGTVLADGTVTKVTVKVTTAFDNSAIMDIGTLLGDADELMDNTEIDLETIGTYVVSDLFDYNGATGAIIGTLANGASVPTVGAAQILIEYGTDVFA